MYKNIRLLLPTALVIFFVTITTAWMDYRVSSSILTSSILENQKQIAGELTRTVSHSIKGRENSDNHFVSIPPVLAEAWRAILPEGKGYLARIVNAEGLVIFCSSPAWAQASNINTMPVAQTLNHPPGTLVPFMDNGTERLGMHMPIPHTDMSVIIGVDRHAAFSNLNALFKESSFVNIIMTLAMLAATLFTLTSLLRTIQRLHEEKRTALLKANQELEALVDERTRALETERTLLRTVFDAIPDSIYYKSPAGDYLACNRSFADLLGKHPEEVIGKTDTELFAFGGSGENVDTRTAISRRDENLCAANGTILQVETLTAPCVNESGTLLGILRISRDISERKHMEFALVRAREEAQEASLAKSSFLANMSHEIRTPMNGIMGLSHLALQVEDMPAQLRSYIKNIDMSARSLLRIINDILDFSKIEAGRLEIERTVFNLDGVLEGVMQPLMPTITEKGLELLFDLAPNVPSVLVGDPTRLRQVIMNLVSNAVKFTHEGSIVIRIQPVYQSDSRACNSSGEEVFLRFVISDTGIGMNEVYKARLFESFSQADTSITRRYGGTGLGLSISKNLVNLMGGDIVVDSEPGKGTSFSFTLPFERGEDVPCTVNGDNLADMNILVADDNEISRKILSENLLRFGARIHVTESGRKAVALFETSLGRNPYDVVILDWKMPELDGLETARRICQRMLPGQKVPTVIMVTAHERDLVLREARDAGISSVLTKPVTPATLREAVLNARTLSLQVEPGLSNTDVALVVSSPLADASEPVEVVDHSTKVLAGKRVLLVEDNEINQLIATEMLQHYGCEVSVATNGLEAVNRASEQRFDAILMDIQMPEMGGIEATIRIRTALTQNGVPIIAMTANAMAGDHARSLQAGMQAHLTKPINPDELYTTLAYWTRAASKASIHDSREALIK